MLDSNKTNKLITSKDLYFLNEIRNDIKKLKAAQKSNLYQIYGRINNLNQKLTLLNDKVGQLSDKVNFVRKEITKHVDYIQSKIKSFYIKLLISIGVITLITIILVLLIWYS